MTPTIYDRSESGLSENCNSYMFGSLGDVDFITIHHSAGPRARTKADCQALNRSYQRDHMVKGWGDIGYHACMDDLGRFYRLRPGDAKGAHVGSWNTCNFGVMLHGNYDVHDLTEGQRASLKWLFRGGFLVLSGEPESGIKNVWGHHDWPGHESNACPGTNLYRHLRWLKATETY